MHAPIMKASLPRPGTSLREFSLVSEFILYSSYSSNHRCKYIRITVALFIWHHFFALLKFISLSLQAKVTLVIKILSSKQRLG